MAHVSEYHSTDGSILPYGFGPTREAAIAEAQRQIAGCDPKMKSFIRNRITTRQVSDDEASEIAEYFETPWD
jgi:hypothetical protein